MLSINFITNIVAPYRIDLFNELHLFSKQNQCFKNFEINIDFMSLSEPNRNWKVDLSKIKFRYKIHWSFKFSKKQYYFYFTPSLILKVIKRPNDHFVLGASWNNFNVFIIIFLKRIGIIKSKVHLWTEANKYVDSKSNSNRILLSLRNYVYNSIDGYYLVPGKISIKTIGEYKLKNDKFIYFPNLVSKSFLNINDYNKSLVENISILIVARLEENLKGILNFLQSINVEVLKGVFIRIIGDGASKNIYENFITTNGLSENIRIIESVRYEEIINEYKTASFLVLPSFNDPSPLVLIEALFSGLPILCSNRCGNVLEVINEGQNGYSFDPLNTEDISYKFNLMLSQKSKWPDMASESKRIAFINFNHSEIFNNLLNILNGSKN
jgi:glycosyltransferase involved in cell wall biosynthesis